MISITKHLQDAKTGNPKASGEAVPTEIPAASAKPADERSTRRALEAVIDNLLETTREHMPAPDAESHQSFCEDLENLGRELKRRSDPSHIGSTSRALACICGSSASASNDVRATRVNMRELDWLNGRF